jgi:predicted NBD/HSP70 family sugar kinase
MPQVFVGIDIGGTGAKFAAVIKNEQSGGDAKLLENSTLEEASEVARGPEYVIDNLIPTLLTKQLKQMGLNLSSIGGIGIDFPAPVSAAGEVLDKANMQHPSWQGFQVREALVKTIGRILPGTARFVTCEVDNDAAATMHGVIQDLLPSDRRGIISGFFVGTGLGGATIIRGENLFKNEGGGSEPGATQVCFDEDRILFGKASSAVYRKLEEFVSLVAIERQLQKLHHEGDIPSGHPIMQVNGVGSKSEWRVRAEKLLSFACKALEEGRDDDFSLRIFEVQRQALGAYVQTHIQNVRPQHIFIGGGVVESTRVTDQFRDWYVEGIKECARDLIAQPLRQQSGFPMFHTPKLGDTAAPLGAAIMALRAGERARERE